MSLSSPKPLQSAREEQNVLANFVDSEVFIQTAKNSNSEELSKNIYDLETDPCQGEICKISDLISYILAVLFLVIIFLFFRYFSFSFFQNRVVQTTQMVEQQTLVLKNGLGLKMKETLGQVNTKSNDSLLVVKSRWSEFLNKPFAFSPKQKLLAINLDFENYSTEVIKNKLKNLSDKIYNSEKIIRNDLNNLLVNKEIVIDNDLTAWKKPVNNFFINLTQQTNYVSDLAFSGYLSVVNGSLWLSYQLEDSTEFIGKRVVQKSLITKNYLASVLANNIFTEKSIDFKNKLSLRSVNIEPLRLTEKSKNISKSIVRGFDLVGNTFLGTIVFGQDFLSGSQTGFNLFLNNLVLGGKMVENSVLSSVDVTEKTIASTFSQANTKILNSQKLFLDYWKKETIKKSLSASSFVSGTTSSLSIKNKLTIDWFEVITQNGLIPALFFSYENKILPLRSILNSSILVISDTGNYVGESAYLAWSKFLNQFSQEAKQKDLSMEELKAQLKSEILQDLQKGDTATLKNGSANSLYSDTGIVLMKSTGANLIDLNNVKNIQDSFSDRVLVNFDQTGDTGIIQPIFRDRLGEEYIFVITPVKK